ncbi:MAG TPA: S-layer homology domain-containing protein [Chloroflexia bacterium]|nr:S-layer homology domain-containing protein [Chloroflexia bacterium]
MLSTEKRLKFWKFTFAALMLALIAGLAVSNLSGGKTPGSPGMSASGPFVDSSRLSSPAEATSIAEQSEQSPVTYLPGGGEVRRDFKHDVSPPLRDIPIKQPRPVSQNLRDEPRMPKIDSPALLKDPVLQEVFGAIAMPTPIVNFEGIYNYWGAIPPDTIGDVGPNHYLQMVNVGFQIYSKTGASLYGPANFNTLFTGFGGLCETRNDGDPVVVYDQLADRWLLSQFTAPPGPYFECIAISTSGDPTGSYHRYAFQVSAVNFEDYPHFGVWPNAYYMATNEFANGTAFVGAGFFAFERDKMLNGQTARMIYFNRPPPYGGFLPSDLDGYTPPAANSPNFFMAPNRVAGNAVRLLKFQITAWDPVPAATLTDAPDIPVAAFDTSIANIPQPDTAIRLDSITDRFMWRLAYRNFGTHDSVVVNHTVDAGGDRAGVRWYEIRNLNTAPTVQQQGTYAPADGLHRWMGSIAMDGAGNMAAGYSVSSSTVYPSIRYAGRLTTDPPGTLPQAEESLMVGGGSQTETIAGRWGDYSSINLDTDDCTFWYTTEYYSVTALRSWRTRIGSFKFPNCTPAVPPTTTPTPTGTPPTAAPTSTATTMPTASATACAGGINTTGTITNTDSVQTGRLGRSAAISSCAVPKTCPAVGDTLVRHYDSYPLTNNSGTSQCVTVRVINQCGNNSLLSAAYLGTFDPNNLCTNYLADMGLSGPDFTYSFNVPAGASYVVTVLENSPNVGCANYNISVSPCDVGTPLPTVTGTPPTATPTITPVPPTVTRTATAVVTPSATPCSVTTLLNEGFETGTLGTFTRTTTLGTFPWTVVTGTVASGTFAAHVDDPNELSDQQLTQVNAVTIPAGATSAQLVFSHTYSFEDATVPWDGGVLEYSTNGTTWNDAGSLITQGGYTGVITVTAGNPLANRPAWVNVKPGFPAFSTVTANLMSLAGQSVRFRFREGSDPNTGAPGWNVDNIRIIVGGACVTGTPATAVPTAIPTGSPPATSIPTVTAIPTITVSPTTPQPTVTSGPPTVIPTTQSTVTPITTPPTAAPTVTGTPPTATNTVIVTPPVVSPTSTGGSPTAVSTVAATATACTFQFSDVPPDNTFYSHIRCLACQGIMGGYSDNTFRPNNNVTRGQLSKIVANSAKFNEPVTTQTFEDVPPDSTFYEYIERMVNRRIITGYPCGGPFEPCGSENRPYFRPNASATRGQISKIVSEAAGFRDVPEGQTYQDVPPENTFYVWIERLTSRGVMSGYPCGSVGEPCAADSKPYFRPNNNATRGQTSKIVANTFFPNCQVNALR